MKHYEYEPTGVCSRKIAFDLDGKTIRNARFTGGCDGNLQAVCRFVEGMEAEKAVGILSGISCRGSGTSCGDRFALALRDALDGKLPAVGG